MRTRLRRAKRLMVGATLLLAAGAAPAQDLSAVFGGVATEWTITDKAGRPARFSVRESEGRTALVPEMSGVLVRSATDLTPGTELLVLVRFANEKSNATLNLTGGMGASPDRRAGFILALGARAGENDLSAHFRPADKGPREYLARRAFKSRWITQRGLGLPDDIRRLIEHQMASLPPLDRKWILLRWQVRKDGTRVYVEDRLLWEGDAASAGRFQFELAAAVHLASVRVLPLHPPADGYETIPLGRYVNASTLDGARVRVERPAEGNVEIGGVPFLLPDADDRGNDHLDLGASWLQCAFTSGRDSPRSGAFGGRWEGAWSVNPARIQLSVPAGRYSAVHLLAAADSDADSAPVVTAQFYIPDAGRPVQARRGDVRSFAAPPGASPRLPAVLESGTSGNIFLVTIPLDPGLLASMGDTMELELTKETRLYRAYPDPMFYSIHGAGLPSSVHVFAVTLERSPVRLNLEAVHGPHVWTAPEKPTYAVHVTLDRPVQGPLTIEAATVSYDGLESTRQTQEAPNEPGREAKLAFEFDLKRYGHHDLKVTIRDAGNVVQTETRGLAFLHSDTRARGDWERGRGPLFGFWNWRGGHNTPPEPLPTLIMGLAGAEADHGSYDDRVDDATKAIARKFGMKGYKAFGAGDHYITARFAADLDAQGIEKAKENFLADLAKRHVKPDDLNRPMFISFYPEPSIGLHTAGVPLSYDGRPESEDYAFTEGEEKRFRYFLQGFLQGAPIVKEHYPGVLCLMPHGDPGFPPPFLRRSPEFRRWIDGVTVDVPVFEKLPEFQMHQVALHRLFICRNEFRKAGIADPWLPMYEGPCLPTRPGSLTREAHAAQTIRCSLILQAYGVDVQVGGNSPFDAGSYWGEQHYGGGLCDPLPLATPKPSYAAFATMTRYLNRRNFDKWVPTGSLSTYALQFKRYENAGLIHVFWTIRGTRPVSVAALADARVRVYDSMDNATELPVRDGAVAFSVGPAPCFVEGLGDAPKIALGAPDHSDAMPANGAVLLSRLGAGEWRMSEDRDTDYEDSFREFIRRYPSRMRASPVDVPADKSGPALAVRLEKPDRDSPTMPFYATLAPKTPLVIPGKASHLGLWVKASSDWGRVVYCLRDAAGERWLSVGAKGSWNCDDIHAWSYFNFDGWRYLRFELPACSPWDLFREAGMTWWGSYSKGDTIPDLPLAIEKIIVERRTHAMYVNDSQPTSQEDILLAGLYAEYESPADRSEQAVERSRLRMPVPQDAPALENPIRTLEATGTHPAAAIAEVTVPLHESDGTRCYVHFLPVDAAMEWEVWASPYPDGRGAIRVAQKITAPNALVRGFKPDTDFYLFLVYTGPDKKPSKPSPAFKIHLKDTFAQK